MNAFVRTEWCEPHLVRSKEFVPATHSVAKTPMCDECFGEKPASTSGVTLEKLSAKIDRIGAIMRKLLMMFEMNEGVIRPGDPSEINRIKQITAQVCGLPHGIPTKSRIRQHSEARWIAMYVARERGFSLPVIGKAFDQHHTSIMYALETLETRMNDDVSLCGKVGQVKRRLAETPSGDI